MIGNIFDDVRKLAVAVFTTIVAAVMGLVDILVNFLDVFVGLGDVIWASAGSLFSAASISAYTLGDAVDWIPAELLSQVAIALAVVYVAKMLYDAARPDET